MLSFNGNITLKFVCVLKAYNPLETGHGVTLHNFVISVIFCFSFVLHQL